MPKQIVLNPHSPLTQGVLIRRQVVADSERSHATLREARARARQLLAEAQEEALQIRQLAYADGFRSGCLESLSSIYLQLQAGARLQGQIEATLKTELRTALSETLNGETVLLQLLAPWLQQASSITALRVILPRSAKAQASVISQRIREVLEIEPQVSIDARERFILEYGEQVLEFSPEQVLDEMDKQMLTSLRQHKLDAQCGTLTKQIVQEWLAALAGQLHDERDSSSE